MKTSCLADDREIRTLLIISTRECKLLDVSKEGLDKLRVFVPAGDDLSPLK